MEKTIVYIETIKSSTKFPTNMHHRISNHISTDFISQLSVFGAEASRLETCMRSITLYSRFCQRVLLFGQSHVQIYSVTFYTKAISQTSSSKDSLHNVYTVMTKNLGYHCACFHNSEENSRMI